MLLLSLVVASPALAATLAVLPLEKGAAGPELEGLGTALSGMIVSDLAGAQGLTLVERQRLDALLSELELGHQGYLDPKTAQQLGKGAGAELVLVGSYSVVGETLALDARLVEVASGKVLDGATAQGALDDFVTVEKDLVEALLSELDATLDARGRRAFYSNVPTESWTAFQAWSQGEARATAGDLEAARVAFQKALGADPDFQAAVDGLSKLQAMIAETKARDTQNRTTRYTAAEDAIMAGTLDPRKRKATDTWTPEELAGLALRWAVRLNRGEHCDRYDEMIAYLDLVEWDPAAHKTAVYEGGPRARTVERDLAERFGYTRWDSSVHHEEEVVYDSISQREPNLWKDTHTFLFHDLSEVHDREDLGVATSLLICKPFAARQREIDSTWRKRLARYGQSDKTGDGHSASGLSNAEQLDVLLAWSEALEGSVSVKAMARLQTLLSRYPDEEEDRHENIVDILETVDREADMVDRTRAGKMGMETEQIRAWLEAIETGEAPFAGPGGPEWCAAGRQETWGKEAERIRRAWDEEIADNDDAYHEIRTAARVVRVVADMGCIQGVDARYSSFEQAAEKLKTIRANKHPIHGDESHCSSLLDALEMSIASGMHIPAPGMATNIILTAHINLVQLRCIVETRR